MRRLYDVILSRLKKEDFDPELCMNIANDIAKQWAKRDDEKFFRLMVKGIPEVKKKRFLKAYHKHRGVMTPALAEANVDRNTVVKWGKSDVDFKQIMDLAKETKLDHYESWKNYHIDKGSQDMLKFALETEGKERGFYKKVESHNVNKDIVVGDDLNDD